MQINFNHQFLLSGHSSCELQLLLLFWLPRLSHCGHLSSSLSPVHYYPVSHQEPTDLFLKCLGLVPSDSNLKTLLFIQVESTGQVKAINSALIDKGLDTNPLITSTPMSSTFINQNFPPKNKQTKNLTLPGSSKCVFYKRTKFMVPVPYHPVVFSSAFSLPLTFLLISILQD